MTATIDGKMWERTRQRIHFQNEDMDYYLMWMLAYQTYAGAQHGECLHAASQIQDGDPESWVDAWLDMARRVEHHAGDILDQGHLVSAREAYLRASTYYRAASVCMLPTERRFYDAWQDMRSCFRIAAALFDPPIQPIEVPFEGDLLPGYFVRPEEASGPRPTVIMIGHCETFAEELYFWAGGPGQRRGYNAILIDLPGQGGTPFDHIYTRIDCEQPIKAVVDYALSRPEVDPDRLALFGIGLGTYAVGRAVSFEKRIKAAVLNAPVMDMHRMVVSQLPGILQKAPPFVGDALAKLAAHQNPITTINIERMCWQAGVGKLSEALEKIRGANLYEFMPRITCPVLCLLGEGESEEQTAQANEFFQALETEKKQLHVFTSEEGADVHCQVNNLSLMHQVVYDWLDEALK